MMDSAANKSEQEISLKDLFINIKQWGVYLFSKWYILLIAGFFGAGIGILYSKVKKPIYTATTTFVLESGENSGGGLSQYMGMAAMIGIDLSSGGGGIFQGDNLLELYKSRKMIEAALLRPSVSDSAQLLIDKYIDLSKTKEVWKEKTPGLLSIDFKLHHQKTPIIQRQRDSILSKAVLEINKNILQVGKPDKKMSIIKIDVKSENEVFAKEFNEALVMEVNEFYIQTKTKKSLDNIVILQHKTDSVRAVMNGAISSAAIIVDATPNLNLTKQAQRIVPSQRSQFSAETNKAILGQLVQNLEMSKMALMKEAPLIQKVDEPIYPLSVERIGKLKSVFFCSIFLTVLTAVFIVFRKIMFRVLD